MSTKSPLFRNANQHDVDHVLRLNKSAEAVTSAMDKSRYLSIVNQASINIVAEIDGQVAGFLLALRDGVDYDNGNYTWFSQRYDDFIYIDRVVVDEAYQGCGIGQSFYLHVVKTAGEQQMRSLACEIDIDPPNASSLSFHEKFGFEEVGTRQLPNGKKVSMRIKSL